MSTVGRVGWILAAAVAGACSAQTGTTAVSDEPVRSAPAEAAQPKAPADGEFANADAMLTALESGDEGLRALSAPVRYIKTFGLAGDTHTREGRLYFTAEPAQGEAAPVRTFAVWFDSLRIGDRLHRQTEAHIFDGRWYVERHEKDKRIVKREVVAPGDRTDPLRLGEGPFPIPLGQRKNEILARFDATLVAPADGLDAPANPDMPEADLTALRAFAGGSHQLRLVPREGIEAPADFEEVRLWYKRAEDGRLLPRMSRTTNQAGDVSYVLLVAVQVNDATKIEPEKVSTRSPEGGGWDIQIEPWQGEGR